MRIRKATTADYDRQLEIYSIARAFMAAHGNPDQWGDVWPADWVIAQDIEAGKSYVCEDADGRVVASFFYDFGTDIDPDYARIDDGSWASTEPYGVVHRIATDGTPGAGTACIQWALAQHPHLRIDTHDDNYVMQGLLRKLGFERRGIIYVEEHANEEPSPRTAFERL